MRGPLAKKRRAKSLPSFAAAAEQIWIQMRPCWRNPNHRQDWFLSLKRFAFLEAN